ncbi:MAG: ferredoxin [Elusimicrobia bacterium CG11_big_fil_rev_8_21_14_0_20_64_6]|nr:MAG: ferredoxin [Elusimicrobia bacterium CG11_big_fil_rev_8_21_14_0_20_64_6]
MSSFSRRDFLKNAAAAGAALAAAAAFARPAAAKSSSIRPPGAVDTDEFLSRCIRCGRCGDACPNQAIEMFTETNGAKFSMKPGPGEENTPVIFPRQQACNLCQKAGGDYLKCTEVCPTGALTKLLKTEVASKVRMGVAKLDRTLCYSYNDRTCGVCIRACPFTGTAMKTGPGERPIFDANFCVGCGLCERACIRYPQAITVVAHV